MAQKASLRLFVLFMFLVFSASIPTTRSIKPNKEDPSAQDLLDALNFKDGNEAFDIGTEFMEARMDFETMDYRPAGPNRDHEPKTPGRA